jgi:hypothetical protein
LNIERALSEIDPVHAVADARLRHHLQAKETIRRTRKKEENPIYLTKLE